MLNVKLIIQHVLQQVEDVLLIQELIVAKYKQELHVILLQDVHGQPHVKYPLVLVIL